MSKSDAQEVLTEDKLIELRENGEISIEKFVEGLRKSKGLFAKRWKVVARLLKKERVIRNKQLFPLAKAFEISGKKVDRLNNTRGFLGKLVEFGVLLSFEQQGDTFYLCNLPEFYTPEEIYELLSESERQRIIAHVTEKPITLSEIARLIYGGEDKNLNFLMTLLAYYISFELVKLTVNGLYSLTKRGKERGLDEQSIKTLKAEALENELFIKQEKAVKLPSSLSEVREQLELDMANKTVPVTDLSDELKGKDLKILFVGEVLYGSQFTDEKLLELILDSVAKPSLVITSGLVQGRFEVKNKAKSRGLVEEGDLFRIDAQYHSAGLLLDVLEKLATNKVCVIQGDDDLRLADDYATQMHLLEGKNPWKWGVDWRSFSAEMKRRLENKELGRKMRIQWEIIQSYMYRIGRSLLNAEEVKAKIGVNKSEYRLIIEIMVAKRNGFAYPKEYEKIVSLDALYGDVGKRIVTPDPLRILLAPGKEIRLVHNAGFSDITQYQETIQHLDAIARHMGLSREQMPWMLADFHQENFFVEYLMGTWIMNLPGMQNTHPAAYYTMKEWNTKILEAKERRQSRVRKEPPSPSAPEIIICTDGRIKFRILNRSVMKVLEENQNQPEKSEVAIVATDMQFGSITNWPELSAKFLDYGLYARKATRMYINGDFIHGNIYPQNAAENRPMRLTSMHAQQMFSFNLISPLILGAPALKDLAAWLGNHEWNNFDSKRSGDSPLTFLETGIQGVLRERERLGIESTLKRAMTVSRLRWRDTHNPQGDIVNWPFFSDTICGFKVAIQHMWQPFGGSNPANEGKRWLKNMARAARSIDLLIGGDKHSVWMTELADKVIVQAGAAASQSGYELARGLMSTVMFTLIEFSNKRGITVEFVPWEFLMNYKFQSPAYEGKDELFVRPVAGTPEYERGKMAPYIEKMIDDQTRYLEV